MELQRTTKELLACWGREREEAIPAPDPAGIARETGVWFVGEDCVLKRSADAEKLRRSFALARLLEAQGLEAAVPVPARDGSEFLRDGAEYVCLMRRLRGSHLHARELYGPGGERLAERFGRAIGGLSLALRSFDAPVEENDLCAAVLGWALPRAEELMELPGWFRERFADRFGALSPLLPRQLIHRDPNLGNVLFSGERFSFLDFDLAERNIRVFDPVYAAGSVLGETFGEEKQYGFSRWFPVWRSILRGYEETAGLTGEEKEALPYVMAGIECIFVAWCADQPALRPLYDASVEMLTMFLERFGELAEV